MTDEVSEERGVVVHLDEADPEKQRNVLRYIANLLAELGEDTPVELVVHGPGLAAVLADAGGDEQLRALLAQGVAVSACANSLRAAQAGPERLVAGVRVVPAGVAQLVRRQRQGWAYLRP